ncbi:uncharacterized protein E0L32_002581 [Thyridium curvatum]|uniref:Uncharacterized protein n=1 Tax=Thyridium curvatum TaxID=1093900 RepID=A0A507BIX2_9PEZI|nr:uncharacterized protein E0L32_002581 [Thyridium curvatum]TPX18724.1 hypothetical protein E0L32_002581 [Thyridium curvatum]
MATSTLPQVLEKGSRLPSPQGVEFTYLKSFNFATMDEARAKEERGITSEADARAHDKVSLGPSPRIVHQGWYWNPDGQAIRGACTLQGLAGLSRKNSVKPRCWRLFQTSS